MIFPEFLYQLSARDQQETWLDPLLHRAPLVSQLATIVRNEVTVRDGHALVLCTVAALFQATGGQFVTAAELQLTPSTVDDPAVFLKRNSVPPAGSVLLDMDWSGQIVVPPLWRVRAMGVFNGLGFVNNVHLCVTGILIPIANIQRL